MPGAGLGHELPREVAGSFEEGAVGTEAGEAEIAEAGLTGAEELALSAELPVAVGELEAVGRLDERLEPCLGDLGELQFRPRDQKSLRLLPPSPDPAAQLVEQREPKPDALLDDSGREADLRA